MLSAGGGVESSSETQIRTGWKKFKELLPLLTQRVFSHKIKGNVSGVLLYGSETGTVKIEDTCRLLWQKYRWLDGCVGSVCLIDDPLKQYKIG